MPPDPTQGERRRQTRGLLLLAALAAAFLIHRAGLHNVFPHGWWHF